jgi:hypothetical protein
MLRALGNVRPSHLVDRKLFDFAALMLDPARGDKAAAKDADAL